MARYQGKALGASIEGMSEVVKESLAESIIYLRVFKIIVDIEAVNLFTISSSIDSKKNYFVGS